MSVMHANVHVVEHAPQRATRIEVRDHRDAKPLSVEHDQRGDRRVEVQRTVEVDRRWDRDRERPVIVEPAPIVVTGAMYTGWTPSSSYTYQPQPLALTSATSLASGQLAIDTTNGLGGATSLQIDNAGSGATYVTQVVTYDANGNYKVTNLNQMVSPQNPTIRLGVDDGACITKIVIDGHSEWGGAIAVSAT